MTHPFESSVPHLVRLAPGQPLLSAAIDTLILMEGDSIGYKAANARSTELAAAHHDKGRPVGLKGAGK